MAAKPGKENKRNAYKGSYYTYGNVAYELQPDYAPYYEDDKKQQLSLIHISEPTRP